MVRSEGKQSKDLIIDYFFSSQHHRLPHLRGERLQCHCQYYISVLGHDGFSFSVIINHILNRKSIVLPTLFLTHVRYRLSHRGTSRTDKVMYTVCSDGKHEHSAPSHV